MQQRETSGELETERLATLLQRAAAPSSGAYGWQRNSRVDFLRGLALLTIFVDHIPQNVLASFTIGNFGFADAAELFVMLAGFSSMVAYGRCFEHDGMGRGVRRVARRCFKLYAFQAVLLCATLLIARSWMAHFGLEPLHTTTFLRSGAGGLRRALELKVLSAYLDILPLYIVLLGVFPLLYAAIRLNPIAAATLSAALWVAANLDRHLNLTNTLTGNGWFFNPLAWQFLFVLGALLAVLMRRYRGMLPRLSWLAALAWAYLAFALIAAAPWRRWGWSDFHPLTLGTDKTNLSLLRILDILSLIYLAFASDVFRRIADNSRLSMILACGRHSLEIFSLGTLLALVGRLAFRTFGTGWGAQLVVNAVGLTILFGSALLLDALLLRARGPTTSSAAVAVGKRAAAGGGSRAGS